MKKLWILFILVTVAVATNAQGLVERYVRATEILQTNLHFVYQGTYTPVQDITYHEFSADSLTWRKDFQEGDCYIRFANTTSNTTNPYTGLSGYHDDWWVFNFCTCNGAIQEGGGSVDTIFVDYGTVIDTVLVQQSIKIPQPDTITGSTVNYQDTLTHTHELIIYIGDNEDVDTTGVADGYVLKYNAITGIWEPHPDLIGAGASGELTVSEIDDDPSVENVVELVVPADHLENLGAGKVYLDLTLDPVNGENDYWRTDTVRVASGDTNIDFSSPLPAADYIIASLYAILDNGNRQDLQYDSLSASGFKVLSVIDSAWVHYIAIRNVDSLLASFENQGKIYATPSDTILRYLSNTVDDSTITVTNFDLTVLNAPNADSLGGFAPSYYAQPFDSVQMTAQTEKAHSAGMFYFDSVRNNFVFYDNNDEVSWDAGKEMWVDAYNITGTTITNGTVVRVDTSYLGFATISLAHNLTPEGVTGVLGVATHDIETGTIGRITNFGVVRDINTAALSEGARIYVSDTPGEFTDTRPVFPNFAVVIGEVLVADATNGEVLVNIAGQPEDVFTNAFDGNFLESFNFTVSSNGTTVTGTLDEQGSKDALTMNFSDGFTVLDVSTPPTVTLTPGTDTNPQLQYVYIPRTTKVLTVSTSSWPTTEYIPIAIIVLKSASATQTEGALRNQNINDHIADTTGQGHISHISQRIRVMDAAWESGAEAGIVIGTAGATPDSVWITTTEGKIWQMHLQTYAAQDMETGDDAHIVNHPTTPYVTVTNLNTQLTNAVGGSLSGRHFSLVIWGVINKTGETSHLMVNLPTGSYTSSADAINDASKFSVYTIPRRFRGVGFLIARATFQHSSAGGGTWTLSSLQDLRGFYPNTAAGGGGSGGSGVTTFLGLTDTPSSYSGFGNDFVVVGASATALEYKDASAIALTAFDSTGFDLTISQVVALSDSIAALRTDIDAIETTGYPEAGIAVSTGSAWGTSITDNSTNWNTAYNDKINSAAFNTSNGVITLTQQDAGTVTVDIDGRFLTATITDNITASGTAEFDSTLTVQMLKQDVLNGTETGDITHNVLNGNVGAYRVDNSGALVVNIHNLSSGVGGVIYLNIATNPSGITVNTFSDAGITGLTEREFGTVSSTVGKTTAITFDCVDDGTNTYVMVTYGESN